MSDTTAPGLLDLEVVTSLISLGELQGQGNGFALQILKVFQDHVGEAFVKAKAATSDPQTLGRIIHRLKGSSYTIGAKALAEGCASFESFLKNADASHIDETAVSERLAALEKIALQSVDLIAEHLRT